MRTFLVVFIIGFSNFVQSQNYIDYSRWINQTDSLILNEKHQEALMKMDSINKFYDFIYASHCVKGLQLSLKCSDSTRAACWLKRCFLQGVPLWMLKQHNITSAVFHSSYFTSILAQRDSLNDIYLSRINLTLRKTIDSLKVIDQFRTNRVNNGFIVFRHTLYGLQWLNRNRKNFEIIKNITENYGFPGEQLIGIDSEFNDSNAVKNYFSNYGPEPNETIAFIILIHYYSTPRKNINHLLLNEVKKGDLPSYQFASINDFIAKYGKSKNDSIGFYNEWQIDKDSTNYQAINQRRSSIGMETFEFNQKIKQQEMYERRNKTVLNSINLH